MNWEHIRLVYCREMRDQLRDRRTMFTIAILPLLLYPVMGMVLLQMTQFHREQRVKVGIVDAEKWPSDMLLTDGEQLDDRWMEEGQGHLVGVESVHLPTNMTAEAWSRQQIQEGRFDLVLVVQPEFSDRLTRLAKSHAFEDSMQEPVPASLQMYMAKGNERSMTAERRVRKALDAWQRAWFQERLHRAAIHPQVMQPLTLQAVDLATVANRQLLLWAKLLPFVMLIWALTGAFYPAIDLCAGEKERGTLETLLCSPAHRRDIVWGKLFAVMSFSIGTAVLNMISMQVTAGVMMQQFMRGGSMQFAQSLGPLPFSALGWLILMLLPIAALFSALALAIASMARSSKEGQYYLMPLLLVGMPLVMIPMLPGVELSIGNSIVPVTGAVLLVRAILEGHYRDAMIHLPFVVAVTAGAVWLAIRWAIGQFESEGVLFRENEKFSMRHWLRHLWRDRGQTASPAEALLCGALILVALFFGRLMAGEPSLYFPAIAKSTLAVQLGFILAPCLVMATMLTRSLREAFRFHILHPFDLVVATTLAVCVHPLYVLLSQVIQAEYAVGAETLVLLKQVDGLLAAAPWWGVMFFLAVLPAVCEELAFRGFILGGLLSQNRPWQAILISSAFFGLSHGMLQQTIAASLMGLLLGYVAWRSGGIWCSLLFHIVHNGLSMSMARCGRLETAVPYGLQPFVESTEQGLAYTENGIWLGVLLGSLCFVWFAVREVPQSFSRRKRERVGVRLEA